MFQNHQPFVSVIIPCRNEEKFIGKCLESIINQDYPKENMEILVVDGISEDKTRKVVETFNIQHSTFNIQLTDNPGRFTPQGLNIGIKKAKGEFIIRMDAHADYPKDYISKCVKCLKESGADNVGGVLKTLPAKNTFWARAIAKVLSEPFGAAGSYFRLGSSKTREVDTVFGGCYKREVFERIGYFNEKLIRAQDIEFNKRLKKAGGKIILYPEIIASYYPQAKLSDFLKHNFIDGTWTTYSLKFGVKIFSLRHLIPLFFVSGFLGGLVLGIFFFWGKIIFISVFGSYLLANLFFSARTAFREDPKYLFWRRQAAETNSPRRGYPAPTGWGSLFSLPLAFFYRHFGYGLGSLWGLIKIILP